MSEASPPTGEPKVDLFVPLEEHPMLTEEDLRSPRGRNWERPLLLFLATCASTFLAGLCAWPQGLVLPSLNELAQLVAHRWQEGLVYMLAVIGILITHEMGHFLQAVRYHVPASYPIFIPLPGLMTGTMGAVILMDGREADRRQLFDIGISGPLAGLVVAVPIIVWGVVTGDPAIAHEIQPGEWHINDPLIFTLLIRWLRPEFPLGTELVISPMLMAGWVGMLITGLNMMPISQLDGGHVIYGLFGKRAHWVARAFVCFVIGAMLYFDSYNWIVMLILVLFIGIDHPPTRNDAVKLGPMRTLIGWLSLLIPIFCFTPVPM